MLEKNQLDDLSQQVLSELKMEKLKSLSPIQLVLIDRLMDKIHGDPIQATNKMISEHLQPIGLPK